MPAVNLADLAGWDLVIAPEAGRSERYAAEEWQRYFMQAGGADLPLVTTVERPDRHVFIGASQPMRQSPVGFPVDPLGREAYRIIVRDDLIAIAGGPPRGTLYGVYAFLEDHLGVRFLTADHTHVPRLGAVHEAGPVDRCFHPPLEMRWSYAGETSRNAAFATRLRVNTLSDEPRLGGRSRQRLISHSFHRQLPSSRYGRAHPDYFCLREGRRLAECESDIRDNEPCLTHPEVLRIITQAVLDELQASPEAINVSVSQNDNRQFCQCAPCAEVDGREGSPMGSLLTLVNGVADQVALRYPDARIGTLAYLYSRKPPATLKPRPNVQIQLCTIECCQLHPIRDPHCPRNVRFCQDLEAWSQASDQIYVWNYNTNFENYLLPLPNLRVIGPNIRTFVAQGAKGIFMQAAGDAVSTELSDLRTYLISRLLWDPALDDQGLVDEFLDLHYRQAAGPIRGYLRHLHDKAEASGQHQHCFGTLAEYGLDDGDAQLALGAFREALALAPDAEVADRVEKASICAYRAALEPVWYLEEGPVDLALAARMRPLATRFMALCAKFGVDRPHEDAELAPTCQRLRRLLGLAQG